MSPHAVARRLPRRWLAATFNALLTRQPSKPMAVIDPARGRPSPSAARALLPMALSAVLGVPSCATTPATRALEVERLQCEATTVDAAPIIERLAVLSVRPLYIRIHSSDPGEVRTRGANLLLRPPEGIDPFRLLRTLQCHSARVLLGREGPIGPQDPFGLADSFLEIDVQAEHGNYLVSIKADSVAAGMQVLARADAFARNHARAPESRR